MHEDIAFVANVDVLWLQAGLRRQGEVGKFHGCCCGSCLVAVRVCLGVSIVLDFVWWCVVLFAVLLLLLLLCGWLLVVGCWL